MKKSPHTPPLPEILGVGEDRQERVERRQKGSVCHSHILSIYLQGGPRYCLDECTYEFTPPVGMLLPEGTLDTDKQQGKLEGIFVLFTSPGLLKKHPEREGHIIVAAGKEPLVVPWFKHLTQADAQQIAHTLQEIKALTYEDQITQMRKVSFLFHALSEYCQAKDRSNKEQIHRETERLRSLIQAWAFENTTMARIYNELDLSAAHAEKLFVRTYGITPVGYRNRLRLERARELLVSSKLNVSQVAFAVGFTDPLYFSRVFHKTFGMTPSNVIWDFANTRV